MSTLIYLITLPLLTAVLLLFLKTDTARDFIVKVSSAAIAVGSVILAVHYLSLGDVYYEISSTFISNIMMAVEILLSALVIFLGCRYKKYLASLLAAVQTASMIWFEFGAGHHIAVENTLYIDRLSIIMSLIIGIIGTLICVYSLSYMKDFARHNTTGQDRRPFFFFLMFVFISAMFGVVTSNNMVWMYFFWEITSLCSFFLIGFTKTPEAIRNSFRALTINLTGGLAFAAAIVYTGIFYDTIELNRLLSSGISAGGINAIPVALLSFAGMTKSAQMPFSSWLLGAMVAPTPTSALLHSSTMVKAGVFLIIKLSPLMGWNLAGIMTMTVGGITFMIASFAAISQSNGKKVLAYSTVANLGLIVACGGIGSPGAVWAAVMLLIFHAVAKSLLFLCVGTAEHQIGSRDIEDMDGLFVKLPKIAQYMAIGICGMFLAPFGMLLSKWIALKAFVDSFNPILVILLVFGSAATLFFWAKWLGKIIAVIAGQDSMESNVHKAEETILATLAFLTAALCILFPQISSLMVNPYLQSIYKLQDTASFTSGNLFIMSAIVLVIIFLFMFSYGKTKKRIVPVYLSGVNMGDNLNFRNSLNQPEALSLRNWYMEGYFGEKKMNIIGIVSCSAVIGLAFILMLGGVL